MDIRSAAKRDTLKVPETFICNVLVKSDRGWRREVVLLSGFCLMESVFFAGAMPAQLTATFTVVVKFYRKMKMI